MSSTKREPNLALICCFQILSCLQIVRYRAWEKLPEAKRGGFERKYEYELRQYRQAASVLRRCQDGGEKIDYKGWKKALDYLNREQFMLDYQLEDMKEEVRRLEIVKREFIQENKKSKPDRYAR